MHLNSMVLCPSLHHIEHVVTQVRHERPVRLRLGVLHVNVLRVAVEGDVLDRGARERVVEHVNCMRERKYEVPVNHLVLDHNQVEDNVARVDERVDSYHRRDGEVALGEDQAQADEDAVGTHEVAVDGKGLPRQPLGDLRGDVVGLDEELANLGAQHQQDAVATGRVDRPVSVVVLGGGRGR